jgi:hypothetical protein
MSVNGHSKILSNGLVFYVDAFNNKSYIGEPTTNLNSDPFALSGNPGSVSWGGYEYTVTRTNSLPLASMADISPYWIKCTLSSASSGRVAVLGTGGLTTAVDYIVSAYVYSADSNITSIQWNSHNGTVSTDGAVVGYSSSDTGTIKRISRIFQSVAGSQLEVLQTNNAAIGSVFYITGVQTEQKSHATPVVNGTRGNTQGLVDLTRNSTVNLANSGYDSNANITFDGSSNYINVPNNSLLTPTSNMSWEFVVNPAAITIYKSIFSKNYYGNSTGFICLHTQNNSLRLEASDVASSTRQLDTNFSNILTLNTNVHCVLTYNGSVFTLYKNGVFVGTASWTYGLGSNNVADFNVGTGWPGYWNGKIHLFKIYNRVLSASEALQNYNATRKRFGLS